MSERYQRLLKHDEPLYLKDSPVIIDAYALLKDTVTDEIKGQIKFFSVSKKRIKALTVKIFPKDAANKKIDEPFDFEYLDLSEDRDNYFGNKQAINMPNKSTREFDARVIRVIFTDNTEWNNDGLSEWTIVKRPTPLRSLLNTDLCEQFKLDYHKDPGLINLYDESNGLWHCSCGAVNLDNDIVCHKCKESKEKLASYDFDEFLPKLEASRKVKEDDDAAQAEELRKKRAQEAEIERQKQEKEKAEKNEKIKKIKSKILKIYLPIAATVICVGITIVIILQMMIIPSQKLKKANSLIENGEYDFAYSLLEEIDRKDIIKDSKYSRALKLIEDGDYDTAYSLLEDVNRKDIITDSKYKRSLKLIKAGDYITAYSLLEEINRNDVIAENKYNRALTLIKSGDYVSAYDLLNGLNYKDSDKKLKEITNRYYKTLWKNVKVGNEIPFGHYKGKENIRWIVLDKRSGKLLVISKDILDVQPYNEKRVKSITWETCTLRKWLNDDFLNKAFSIEEQKMIPTMTISADRNPEYNTNPGKDTRDKIFLLSISEVNKYLPSKVANSNSWWWLRTPGSYQDYAACVFDLGGNFAYGNYLCDTNRNVRPALWIDLNA